MFMCKLVAMDEHQDRQEQQENSNGALLRLADIKGSLQMLQAVKSPAKQVSDLSKSTGCESDSTCIDLVLCLTPHAEHLCTAASHCDH